MNSLIALLGRVLLSAIFVLAGFKKLTTPAATIAEMAHFHLPVPQAAWVVAVVFELLGGVAVLVGWRTRWAAIALAFWSVATALVAHTNFANQAQMINFMKNMSMAGGFLMLYLAGPGRFSVDRR